MMGFFFHLRIDGELRVTSVHLYCVAHTIRRGMGRISQGSALAGPVIAALEKNGVGGQVWLWVGTEGQHLCLLCTSCIHSFKVGKGILCGGLSDTPREGAACVTNTKGLAFESRI